MGARRPSYASMEAGAATLSPPPSNSQNPTTCPPGRGSLQAEQREKLIALCRKAGIREAEKLADTLSLLLEGARVNGDRWGRMGLRRGSWRWQKR